MGQALEAIEAGVQELEAGQVGDLGREDGEAHPGQVQLLPQLEHGSSGRK